MMNRYLLTAGLLFSLFLARESKSAEVGVIDVNGKYSDIDQILLLITALGHKPVLLPEKTLTKPTGLGDFDCIILSHRNGILSDSEYLALDEYVKDGGTLLLTNTAGYWLRTPGESKKQRRIAGEGPIKKLTGVRIVAATQYPILDFKVLVKNNITKGLPLSFKPETTPAYNSSDKKTVRWRGVLELKATTAEVLIKVRTEGANSEMFDFLTLNLYGKGRCVWIGCRLTPIILGGKEKNLARILNNILKSSSKR